MKWCFFPLCSISELGWSKRSYRVDFRVRVRFRVKSRYFLQFRGRFITSYDLLAHIGFLLIEPDFIANYFMEGRLYMDNLSRFLSFIPCFPLFHVLLLYSPGQLGYNVHFRISVANRFPNDFGYILLHILPWFTVRLFSHFRDKFAKFFAHI
jgi:hypothetical protein